MKKNKTNISVLVIVIMFIYAGYSFYSFETNEIPKMRRDISSLEKTLQEKEDRYKKLKNFSENIESVKNELKELNIQFQTVLEHLPSEFNYSELLRDLTKLARNSGVDLLTFDPDKEEKHEEGTFYATNGLKIELKGPYTGLVLFFDQLSRFKKIINVKSIMIKPEFSDNAVLLPQIDTKADIALLTYRFFE